MKTAMCSCGDLKFVFLENDVYIGKSLQTYGEYSFGEIELLKRVVSAGDNVLEVGANIGAHSVFIARDVCPGGTLYAFDLQSGTPRWTFAAGASRRIAAASRISAARLEPAGATSKRCTARTSART